jgi:SAM-dependent methyltransferase
MSTNPPPPVSINQWFMADEQFDSLYPLYVQLLSKQHWTPLHVIKRAARFLAPQRGTKVLDIGSGAGKFCLAGAYLTPYANFYGVEQRPNLLAVADEIKSLLRLNNACFLLQNFAELEFGDYDSFYFFNSFYENLPGKEKIDNHLPFSQKIYQEYSFCLFEKLSKLRAGTRLVTYHCFEGQVPPCFHLQEEESTGLLKFWIKRRVFDNQHFFVSQ